MLLVENKHNETTIYSGKFLIKTSFYWKNIDTFEK